MRRAGVIGKPLFLTLFSTMLLLSFFMFFCLLTPQHIATAQIDMEEVFTIQRQAPNGNINSARPRDAYWSWSQGVFDPMTKQRGIHQVTLHFPRNANLVTIDYSLFWDDFNMYIFTTLPSGVFEQCRIDSASEDGAFDYKIDKAANTVVLTMGDVWTCWSTYEEVEKTPYWAGLGAFFVMLNSHNAPHSTINYPKQISARGLEQVCSTMRIDNKSIERCFLPLAHAHVIPLAEAIESAVHYKQWLAQQKMVLLLQQEKRKKAHMHLLTSPQQQFGIPPNITIGVEFKPDNGNTWGFAQNDQYHDMWFYISSYDLIHPNNAVICYIWNARGNLTFHPTTRANPDLWTWRVESPFVYREGVGTMSANFTVKCQVQTHWDEPWEGEVDVGVLDIPKGAPVAVGSLAVQDPRSFVHLDFGGGQQTNAHHNNKSNNNQHMVRQLRYKHVKPIQK